MLKIKAFIMAMILSIVAITCYSQVKFDLTAKANGISHADTVSFELISNSYVIVSPGEIIFSVPDILLNNKFKLTSCEVIQNNPNDDIIIGYSTDQIGIFIFTVSCPFNGEEYLILYNQNNKTGIIFKFRKSITTINYG